MRAVRDECSREHVEAEAGEAELLDPRDLVLAIADEPLVKL